VGGKSNKSTLGQFYQRKVMRVALAYTVVGWITLQVGEVTFDALALPSWALTLLIAFVILGFPIALVLAWAYEVTPEGIVKDPLDSTIEEIEGTETDSHSMPSIAVLPFDDMSEHGNQAYFCEGMAEEILNALCKVAGLRVASRVASFRFGPKRADIAEIGQKLHVKSVLEGSVRQFGEHLRVTAQLVDTKNGYHLWTHQYDRQKEDLFAIQEDIAEHITIALCVTLKNSHFREQSHVDPKAYDFYLRGRYYFSKLNLMDSNFARQMFQRALDIEAGYGRAWAWLAYTNAFEYMYLDATDTNREEAVRTSQKALEVAPGLAESHIAAGVSYCMIRECKGSEKEFRKAIELDPKRFEAWYFYGRSKVREGKLEVAIGLLQEAARVRPEDYQSVLLQAQLYMSLNDTKHALEASRKGVERAKTVLEFNPDEIRALNLGALALLRLGEVVEAEQWMSVALKRAPRNPIILYNGACFFALKGDVDKALDALQQCLFKVGVINRSWLDQDSDLDNIRGHPRFSEIIIPLQK
jgi:adenylate cyclase